MSVPATIRQSEIKRAIALAKANGCVIEIEKNGMKIRVFPDSPDIHRPQPSSKGKGIRL